MAFWDRWRGTKREAAAPAPAEPEVVPEFPFPLVAVPGASAVGEWHRLRTLWRPEGHVPLLLGDRGEVESLRDGYGAHDGPIERILADASRTAPQAFFEGRLSDLEELGELPIGAWPDPPPAPCELGAHCDVVTGEPKPTVYIARIPTPRPHEVFAFLKYGGWNDCPSPEDQVAVHRRWYETYGAEPYAVAGDVVECWVPRPPGDRDAAEALAREQYLYCADIVEQGTQTVRALAASLRGAGAWFFWWD